MKPSVSQGTHESLLPQDRDEAFTQSKRATTLLIALSAYSHVYSSERRALFLANAEREGSEKPPLGKKGSRN